MASSDVTVVLDIANIGDYLKYSPEVHSGIDAAADAVSTGSRIKDTEIRTDISDRYRALVVAKHGNRASDELGGRLIAAASALGLDVVRR